jgi:hypothetical protein
VNTKTQDVESISYNAASNTLLDLAGEVRFPTSVSTTNRGIISIVDDSANTRTKFVALKDCTVSFNFNAPLTSSSDVLVLYKNGVNIGFISSAAYTAGGFVSGSWVGQLKANDYLTVGPTNSIVSTTTPVLLAITATADNNATASPTQQVSSDTMNFVFKSTAITTSDAIGTFNTYTYAATSNAPVIATSAPTQTVSSMNTNGIQVFARSYNNASTAASPARVDIFIGTGLKSTQVNAYGALAKTVPFSYDLQILNSTTQSGSRSLYNEITGILTIDVGYNDLSAITSRIVGVDSAGNANILSGYFVFNASKSPSLVTIPQNVSVSALYTGAPPTGSLVAASSVIYGTKVKDSHGAYNVSTGAYVIPISGTYDISAQVQMAFVAAVNLGQCLIYIDGVNKFTNSVYSNVSENNITSNVNVKAVPLLAGQIVTIRAYTGATTPSFVSDATTQYFSISKSGSY